MAGRILGSFDALIANLQQAGGWAAKSVNDGMEEAMRAVQQEAIHRAPLDHGNLEAAIKLSNEGLRKSWAVFVDETMPDDTGKYTVGDYAMWLHEGQYNLGPKSQAKNTDGKVGRKYLEAPFQEMIEAGLIDKLQARLFEALAGRRR